MGKNVLTTIPGGRRFRDSLRHRLMNSVTGLFVARSTSAAGAGAPVGGGTRRQRRAAKAKGGLAAGLAGAVALSGLFAVPAFANPTGGTVTAGAASIDAATPSKMTVTQSTDKAIVNWKSFSIGSGESVQFKQPSSSSVTLNRVTGGDTSAIMGSLSANGTVMLVNPNGVVFGRGAKVDVGGLVATTANISDANFMAGKYKFDKPSDNPNAAVVNQGDIKIKDSGLAALVAPQVRNSGVIRAKLGKVALGGAETFTLDFHGDGLISFDAGSAVKTVGKDANGNPAEALVVNTGEISAPGGSVTLSARAVKGVIDNVINTTGVVKATSISGHNGTIVLSGGDSGAVNIGGMVDASGRRDGQTGGTVSATGAAIAVARGAVVDTSGDKGGGTIAIGSAPGKEGKAGSWSGRVTVASGAALKADALTTGKGGTVTVLAEKSTKFAGNISARGGAKGGDGGFAEVSSREVVSLTGGVDLSAAKGSVGTFLLDPATLRIVSGSGGSQDSAASDGTISSGDADSGANTVSKTTLEGIAGTSNIVLEATGKITVETSLSLQTAAGHSFTLHSTGAGGNITFTDTSYEIATNGGAISLLADGIGGTLTNVGKLTTKGGDVTLTANGSIGLANAINTTPTSGTAGAVSLLTGVGSITGTAAASITGGSVSLSAQAGSIGASGAAIATTTTQLSATTGADLYVANTGTLTNLSITAGHASSAATGVYQLSSTGLTFAVTDGASALALDTVSQTSGLTQLALTSDRTIQIGTVNAGSGAVALTSTAGNITATSGGLLTAGNATLTAKGTLGNNGAIGTMSQSINGAVTSLTAAAGSGGVYFANNRALALTSLSLSASGNASVSAAGDLTVGSVSGVSALTLTSTAGSVLNDADATTTIGSSTLAVTASGAIGGSSNALTTSATSLSASAASGGVYLNTTAISSTLSNIVSTNGDIAVTTGGVTTIGSITSANGTSNISVSATGTSSSMTVGTVDAGASGNVSLTTAAGSISSSGSAKITGNAVTLTAGGTNSLVNVNSAGKSLTISSGTGGVTVTQTGAVTLDSVLTTGSSISVTASGGDVTVGTVGGVSSVATVSIQATGGSILSKDATSLIKGTFITLGASSAIGTSAGHINTTAPALTLTSAGNIYVDNTGAQLTSLTITNRHNGSTANAIQLTSDNFQFAASDDGTATTLTTVAGPLLSAFSYNSDKGLVVGTIKTWLPDDNNPMAQGDSVTLTAGSGSILDDGSANTWIASTSITLTASLGGLGSSSNTLNLNTAKLGLSTNGDLNVTDLTDLTDLTVISTHATSSVVNTYKISAPSLLFAMTDDATNGYTLTSAVDNTGLTFGFKGDRDIRLGTVNLTNASSKATFETTNGSILDDGSQSTSVLAETVTLKATGAIGASATSEDVDIIAATFNASASNGGIWAHVPMPTGSGNFKNAVRIGDSGSFTASGGPIVVTADRGDILIGSSGISSSGNITVTATNGSVIDNSSSGTITASGNTVTLSAGKAIGSSDYALKVSAATISATAGTSLTLSNTNSSSTTLTTAVATTGDVSVSKNSGTLTLGTVSANGGAGTVTISANNGSIADDNNSATVVAGSKLVFSAGSGVTANTTTGDLTITAPGSISITDTMALSSLALIRSSGSGSIGINTVFGQTFSLSDSGSSASIGTLTSTSALNFALSTTRNVNLGAISIGTGGSFTLQTTGSINSLGGSSKVTADTVSLTAGSGASIGSSATPVGLDTADLTVSAGRDIYVTNNGRALTNLTVTSTNTTTSTTDPTLLSTFSIAGTTANQTITLTDAGTKNTVDVSGSSQLTNFSFASSKSIEVSKITVSGNASLSTTNGGVNSNITSDGGSGRINAASVTLTANGSDITTGTNTSIGNGSIGTSGTKLRTNTASLTVTSNGNVYVDNNNTALTTFSLTATHKTSASGGTNSYGFANLGTSRNVSVDDSAGVMTLGMSAGSGTMAFSFTGDRAIALTDMDAGDSSHGSISVTSTSAASGQSPTITWSSGRLTAGQVTLSAVGSNSAVGTGTSAIATTTQKLSVASGGNVYVSNNTTLTDLTLDARHKKSPSGANSYSISSTGLTFNVTDTASGSNVLNLANISQSGLNLTVYSDKSTTVTNVDVGAGSVLLSTQNSSASAPSSTISATKTSTVVTAGSLTLNATSVGNTNSGNSSFYTKVGTLSAFVQNSLNITNDGNLTLNGLVGKPTSSSSSTSATIKLTNNGSLLQSGTTSAAFDTISLDVSSGGSIGTSGTAVLTDTRQLTLKSGRNVYLTNASDLFSLDMTANHSSPGTQNNFAIQADGLTFALTDSGAGNQYTLSSAVDASGLDFTFSSDVALAVGTVNGQMGRTVTLTTTGTNLGITSTGSSLITADTVALTATGAIGATGTAANHIQTSANGLTLATGGNVYVDNALDMESLSITQNGAGTPNYEITGTNLSFSLADDGTTTSLNTVTDTTGLVFTMNSKHALAVGTIDVKGWGTVSLTTDAGILGTSSSNHLTAGTTSLTATNGNLGSSSVALNLSTPVLTLATTGNLYATDDVHLETLSISNSYPNSNARTFSITGVDRAGQASGFVLSGTDTGSAVTLSQVTDTSGTNLTYTTAGSIVFGAMNVGNSGRLTVSATSMADDGDSPSLTQIQGGWIKLTTTSGAMGATGGNNALDISTGTLVATSQGGAYLSLHSGTNLDGSSFHGATVVTNDTGDLALGGMNMNGNALTVTNTGGSIVSGTLSNTAAVTLTAAGSIGNGSTISTSANSNGTTTLTATAAANGRGATGSVSVTEGYGLSVTSVSAVSDVTITAGGNGGNLAVGTINAGSGKVALTASGTSSSITGLTGNLVTGGGVKLIATGGSIGTSGQSVNVATTDLTINTAANIYVADSLDLAKLTIDRTPTNGNNSSGTLALSAQNLSWSVTDTSNTTTFTNVTDTTGLDFNYTAKGSVVVNTINTGANSTDVLQTTGLNAGGITAGSGSSTITAGTLTLSVGGNNSAIGSSGTLLGLNVGTLTASSGTGGLFVKNAGSLNLSSLSTSGDLTAKATTGDLTIGTVSYGSSKTATLEATAGRILAGSGSLTVGSGTVMLKAATGIGTALAPVVASGGIGALSATTTGTGNVYLDVTSDLTSTGLSVDVHDGAATVGAGGNILLSSVTSDTDAVGNDITVTARSGSITVGVIAAGSTKGKVSLTANSGSISGGANNSVAGSSISLTAQNGIGNSTTSVKTNGASIQAVSTSASYGVYLSSSNATTFANVTSGNIVKIDTTASAALAKVVSGGTSGIVVNATGSGHDLLLGSLNAGSGNVTVTSGSGSVLDDGVDASRVVGATVALNGNSGVGTSARKVQTTASTITSVSGAGVFIDDDNASGVTLSSIQAIGGAVAITTAGPTTATSVTASTDAAGNNVSIATSSGNLTVASITAGTSNGAVTLTAAGSILASGSGTHVTAKTATMTASGGNIGAVTNLATGAGTPIKLNVGAIGGLTANGATPVISVDNGNTSALTLVNNAVTLATGGSAYIKTAGDLDASAGLTMSNGNLLLQSGGTLTLPTTAINLGSGALTLKGTTDVVASGASPRSLSVTAASLVFSSGSNGGDTTLNTTVGTIDASLTGTNKNLTVSNTGTLTAATLSANGNVTVTSSTGLTADSVTATGSNRTITLTATAGDLTVKTLNAGADGSLVLSAAAGSILTATGASFTGDSLDMTTATGVGTSANPFTTSFSKIKANVTGTGGIYLSGGSFTLGNLTTNNGDISVTATGSINDTNATTGITAGGGGNITLTAATSAVLTKQITTTGSDTSKSNLTIQASFIDVGKVTTTGAQTYTGNTALTNDITGKSILVTGNVSLVADPTFDTSAANGDITFTGTFNGGNLAAFFKAGTGTVTLGGASTNLASLEITAGAINIASVTTTGTQTYTGATTLNGTYATTNSTFGVTGAATLGGDVVVSTGTAGITFGGTVNGAHALTVNSTGATQFNAAVGATTALSSLTSNAGGTISLKSVTTSGAQSYGEAATLTGTYTTTNGAFGVTGATTLAGDTVVSTGTGAITFGGAVNGAQALTVNSTGATQFNAVVGGTTALSSLTSNAGGTIGLLSVTTTGNQSYGEAATLNGTYTTGGAATFQVAGAATLGGAVIITGGGTTFSSTVDGAQALTVTTGAGDAVFAGTVGGTTRLGAVTINSSGKSWFKAAVKAASTTTDAAGTLVIDGGSVDTTGAQSYADATTFGADTVLTGTLVTLTGGADAATAGAQGLTITGNAAFTGAYGSVKALKNLSVSGTTGLNGGSIGTTGAQGYTGAVTLATAAETLTSTTGGITFGGTLDGGQALTVNGGTGDAVFTGLVGGTTRLGALTVNDSGKTWFKAAVKAASVATDAAGTLVIDGGSVDTTGAQSYADATTFGADTVLTGTLVTLTGGADAATAGSQGLTITGNAAFTGAYGSVKALKNLSVSGTTGLNGGSIGTTGAQGYTGAVTLATAAETLTSATGGVTFGGTLDGGQALTVNGGTGDAVFSGLVGGTTRLGALSVNDSGKTWFKAAVKAASITTDAAGTLVIDGGSVDTTGAQSYADATTFGADTVLTGTLVTLSGGADAATAGAQGLTINGALTATDAIGNNNALKSLTVNGGPARLMWVTTKGAQSYNGDATLNGSYWTTDGAVSVTGVTTLAGNTAVSTGSGAITFGGAVDGAYALTVISTGATQMNAAVGANTALTNVTSSVGGTISLKSVTTTGAQTYNAAATLNGTYTTADSGFVVTGTTTLAGDALVTTGSGAITFGGAVNGAQALTVNSTGATQFSAAVGGTTALSSLTSNAGGTIGLLSVTTTGNQSYGEAATLNGTYTTGGAATFQVAGAATLGGAVIITGGGATFNSTVDGAQALTVSTGSGDAVFAGVVGGTTRLGAVTVNSGGKTWFKSAVTADSATTDAAGTLAIDGGSVDTTGAQSYADATTFGADTVLKGTLVTLTGGADAATAGAQGLTITGNAAFTGAYGVGKALKSLSVSGATGLNGGSIVTSGSQTYGDTVTLATAAETLTSATAGITFNGLVDGAQDLTLNGGNGDVRFNGNVGGVTRLGALTINDAGQTVFGATVKAASVTTDAAGTLALYGGNVDTTGAQSYADAVTFGADTVLTGTLVTLTGGADAATAGAQGLTITGNAAFAGAYGSVKALKNLSVSGTTGLNGGSIGTTGAQGYTGAVTLATAAETLTSATGGVTFGGALDGGQALTVNGGTGDAVFSGLVGGTTRLGSLTVNDSGKTWFKAAVKAASITTDAAGTLVIDGGSVDTTGAQSYADATTFGADTVLTGTLVTLSGGADAATAGAQGLTVNGALTASAAVGATKALKSVTVVGGPVSLLSVTTTGAQSYTGATTLNGTYTTTNSGFGITGATTLAGDTVVSTGTGDVTFGGSVDGAKALTVNSTGATLFNAAVGGTTALASLTSNAGGTIGLLSVTTTGDQSYGEAATLNGTYKAGTGGRFIAGGAVTLGGTTAVNAGGGIRFAATLDGAQALTLNSGNADSVFAAAVGGTTRLGAIQVASGGATRFAGTVKAAAVSTDTLGTVAIDGGSVDTTGTQSYGERVVLGADTVLTGTTLTLSGGGDAGTASRQGLTVNGDAVLGGAFGANAALKTLTVGGTTTLTGGSVTTSGAQSFVGATSLTGDSVLGSSGGDLVFGSTIDTANRSSLSLQAGGALQVAGAVGGAGRLGDVTIRVANGATFAKAFAARSVTQTANGGTTRFAGTLTADGSTGISLTGASFTFDAPVTATAGGLTVANSNTNGTTVFATDATLAVAGGFTQTGGAGVVLPASVTATGGPIAIGAVATLPEGSATITSGAGITMTGLSGTKTKLTMASTGNGALVIGVNNGSATEKIKVLTLTVPTAGSASMFGTVAGSDGALAASAIDSPLRAAPYFINTTPWGPTETVSRVVSTVVVVPPVPSTPGVNALFTGTVTSAGLTPNALSAFAAPQVLTTGSGTTPSLTGAGTQPSVLGASPTTQTLTTTGTGTITSGPITGGTGAGVQTNGGSVTGGQPTGGQPTGGQASNGQASNGQGANSQGSNAQGAGDQASPATESTTGSANGGTPTTDEKKDQAQ